MPRILNDTAGEHRLPEDWKVSAGPRCQRCGKPLGFPEFRLCERCDRKVSADRDGAYDRYMSRDEGLIA